ncbi:MAG TPA: PEP-utilizing enzyme [Candidatus Paceibacterota bacterium]
MKTYTKIYNRSLPMYAVQYWYRGVYSEIAQLTGVHCIPLFYYEEGRATSVYFEKSELKLMSDGLLGYYVKNPGELEKTIEQYKKLHQDALVAIEKKDSATLFDTAIKIWPALNSVMLLGGIEHKDPETQKIKDIALKARTETDRLIYEVGNGLWDSIDTLIPEESRSFLTIEEIVSKRYPALDEIGRRKKSHIYTNDTLTTGVKFSDFLKINNLRLEEDSSVNNVDEFSGSIAYKGKVTGKVRIVLEFKDMFKFNEGEVLVSSMTVPDFLPVMKKAIAFITDEGGITCHAAIIAREMKKPCIIGTKIATQVLKDGDMVEVDAENGIVKIIK